MKRHVFLRIMNAVQEHDNYFMQKRNAAGILELSCPQKVGGISDVSLWSSG
jgi:hypothetical protein